MSLSLSSKVYWHNRKSDKRAQEMEIYMVQAHTHTNNLHTEKHFNIFQPFKWEL